MKKNIYLLLILILLSACNSSNNNLIIRNESGKNLQNLIIDYKKSKDVVIKKFNPNDKYVHKIITSSDDSVKLSFEDSNQNKYQYTIIGYIPANTNVKNVEVIIDENLEIK